MTQVFIPQEVVMDFWLCARSQKIERLNDGSIAYRDVSADQFKTFMEAITGLTWIQLPVHVRVTPGFTRWVVELDETDAVTLRLTDYQNLRELATRVRFGKEF